MKRILILALSALWLCAGQPVEGAKLRLPSILGEHMVLQQNTVVNLWGWADPGSPVEVIAGWNGQTYRAIAGMDGGWLVRVPTSEAGGPFSITFRSDTSLVLEDVLLGEVWVCSGQSNMEWTLARAHSAQEELPRADLPGIRLFRVEKKIATRPLEDVIGSWQLCNPTTAKDFSAVGYFFGRHLHEVLGFPVGLINSSWGGTPSEAWTSRETMQNFDYFRSELDKLYDNPVPDIEKSLRERDSIESVIRTQRDFMNPANIGMKEGWMKEDYDDSHWMEVACPAEWSTLKEIGTLEGVAWMRTRCEIPESWIGKNLMLELGPVDEMDVTYLNGRKVGSSPSVEDWDKDRHYRIPGQVVTRKELVLAIRIVNTVAQGGLFGKPEQLRIFPVDDPAAQPVMLAGKWRFRIEYDFPELPQSVNPNSSTVLYNGMIHPITKMTIRGAIWYQGESNVNRAVQYREIFPAMIGDWRTAWGQGDFPFYFVQIAPYRYGEEYTSAELREAQFMTLATVRNTGMAVTLDIGNPEDIHPTNKRDVGKRLALWALAKDYGKEVVCSGPLYRDISIEGSSIRVHFDHTGTGLQATGGPLTHFEIAGEEGIYYPAIAEVEGHTVVVTAPQVKQPMAVRYGWSNTAEPNLFNLEGLPASSFCSDNWPRITQ
jgi:sialate O-acetylesterase